MNIYEVMKYIKEKSGTFAQNDHPNIPLIEWVNGEFKDSYGDRGVKLLAKICDMEAFFLGNWSVVDYRKISDLSDKELALELLQRAGRIEVPYHDTDCPPTNNYAMTVNSTGRTIVETRCGNEIRKYGDTCIQFFFDKDGKFVK